MGRLPLGNILTYFALFLWTDLVDTVNKAGAKHRL